MSIFWLVILCSVVASVIYGLGFVTGRAMGEQEPREIRFVNARGDADVGPDSWPRDRLTCRQCGKTDGTHLSDCGWRPGEV